MSRDSPLFYSIRLFLRANNENFLIDSVANLYLIVTVICLCGCRIHHHVGSLVSLNSRTNLMPKCIGESPETNLRKLLYIFTIIFRCRWLFFLKKKNKDTIKSCNLTITYNYFQMQTAHFFNEDTLFKLYGLIILKTDSIKPHDLKTCLHGKK